MYTVAALIIKGDENHAQAHHPLRPLHLLHPRHRWLSRPKLARFRLDKKFSQKGNDDVKARHPLRALRAVHTGRCWLSQPKLARFRLVF